MKQVTYLLFLLHFSSYCFSQHIDYLFSAPNAAHHEAEITVTASGLKGSTAIFRMSRSSPGRYAKHEFGKNVYNVAAVNEAGKPLKAEKEDADIYKVTGQTGTVTLSYTLFGDYADGTYSSIDLTAYHLNMPATFMWVKGLENAPINIRFTSPNREWKVATQLKPTSDPYIFTAPDLQYFMDSPTRFGKFFWREWTVANPNHKSFTFRLALDAESTETMVDSFTTKLMKVVQAAKQVFGEFPEYDYGTYTFIATINRYVRGDGMEHRNSTMITIPAQFDGSDEMLSVFAHEFFHCWNVERIRPKSLEPFNFEKSNMSEALWVAEGFTQYYGSLLLVRAGLLPENDFLQQMSGLVNAKSNSPGATLYTPIENSQRAVFVDAGVSIDKTNYSNMYTSYYLYGGALALALDLQLRSKFHKSLDDVMTVLWQKQGKPFHPYTIPDVENAVSSVTNPAFASSFFKNYVYSHDSIDYAKLFGEAGYTVKKAAPGIAYVGRVGFENNQSGAMITQSTLRNTPLYNAGLDAGDVIETMDGHKVKTAAEINELIKMHQPGDTMAISYFHRSVPVQTTIVLAENPTLLIEKQTNINQEQKQFKLQWLHKSF